MWNRAYWQTVAERVIGGAAAAAVGLVGLDDWSWGSVGVAAAKGALAALVISLGSTAVGPDKGSPLITASPPAVPDPDGV